EGGVVVIDALFLQADARLLAGMIRSTGQPLLGILLTPPHVDHFGRVPAPREAFPGVRLFATAATAAASQATHARGVAAGWQPAGMIRSPGKRLLGVLLTHPRVDRFGGVPGLREAFPGVRLCATAGTAAAIQATHDRGVAAGWLQAMMGEAGYGGPARVDSII